MQIIYTDALIVGGGLAGLRTAIGIKRRGFDCIVLSLVPPKRSHSAAAQGGMQASLANCNKGYGDNEDIHFLDTVRGSDWGADQQIVRMFVHTAPKAVRELAAWGVPWNRVVAGDHTRIIDGKPVTVNEHERAHGLITARNFGGTQKWRTCYVSDGTGHSMLYNMSNQAIAEQIPVHERTEVLSLIHDGERCHGAIVRNLISGSLSAYVAKATCIATGGYGRIYRNTTNAVINEGMGAGVVLETGVASLANMEAVQFHPTGIFPAGILVTEGCRGDGGLLLDGNLHRFMPDYEPEKKELASRDVVSRCMEQHIAKGCGAKSPFGDHLWLDIRLLGRKHIDTRLREVKEICQYFLGIDPAEELIPTRPAQHYSMGGVRTDYRGESPELRGLFAGGEAACWDIHGFNRLGGNSVAETVVAGMIIGEFIADYLGDNSSELKASTGLVEQALRQQETLLAGFANAQGGENPFVLRERMQSLMTDNVAIFRNGERLQTALQELQQIAERAKHITLSSAARGANPELVAAYRLQRMVKLALCVTLGALRREESRGAHYREDFPLRNDRDFLSRTVLTWPQASTEPLAKDSAPLPDIRYHALDINTMELPPGWRGYGSKEHIEHPATAERQAAIDALRVSKSDAQGKPFDSEQLLAFKHLLPEPLRGDNARLDLEANS